MNKIIVFWQMKSENVKKWQNFLSIKLQNKCKLVFALLKTFDWKNTFKFWSRVSLEENLCKDSEDPFRWHNTIWVWGHKHWQKIGRIPNLDHRVKLIARKQRFDYFNCWYLNFNPSNSKKELFMMHIKIVNRNAAYLKNYS